MKRDSLNIICCPICKEDLKLKVKREKGDEIIEGTLICKKCRKSYAIEKGIPNLLP